MISVVNVLDFFKSILVVLGKFSYDNLNKTSTFVLKKYNTLTTVIIANRKNNSKKD
mgnify:CR=1 FL=1